MKQLPLTHELNEQQLILLKKEEEKSDATQRIRMKRRKKLSYTSLKMRVLTQFGEGGPDDRGGDEGEPD